MGKHVINLYSTGISRMVKIRDVKTLQQDIESTFGNFLAPVLVAAYTVNYLDLGEENKGDKSD